MKSEEAVNKKQLERDQKIASWASSIIVLVCGLLVFAFAIKGFVSWVCEKL